MEEKIGDTWQTPKKLFDELNKQYNFDYDCCCNLDNTKCANGTGDFLSKEFEGDLTCWMNPPFSKANQMFQHFFKVSPKGVAIYRCDNMETVVWQDIILKNANWILIPNKRITYEGLEQGQGIRFPSAIIGFNVDYPENIKGTLFMVITDEMQQMSKDADKIFRRKQQ